MTSTIPRSPGAGPDRPIGIGILGATGYSGMELLRLLAEHPNAAVLAAGSRQHAGNPLGSVLPALRRHDLVLEDDPTDPRAWRDRGVEVVFSALPHGVFAARARAFIQAGIRVVDLSADFRLRDPQEYPRRYGLAHPSPDLLPRAIYGLSEWCADELAGAPLVANPGCYPTAVLLATLPAVAAGLWNGDPLVANALSGVSGAGRAAALGTHFVEAGNGAAPYRVGEEHAHRGEMQQLLRRFVRYGDRKNRLSPLADEAGEPPLVFNPHLVPMARGIVANVAIPLREPVHPSTVEAIYHECYAGRPFVHLLEGEALPESRHVRGSNRCDLALRVVAGGRMLLAFAAIDNLVKGAAGQAIQNWNLSQGWPEVVGLPVDGWACA